MSTLTQPINQNGQAPATAVEQQVQGTVDFTEDKEYSFSMRSFRYRNQWAFCTVTYQGGKIEILIGAAVDYPLPAMLQAKQFGGNVYGTFKGMHNHNGVDYPRFWDVSVG